MFNFSRPVFETNNLDDVDVIFVADLFASDYNGGAELTSQALIDASPYTVGCIKASDVTLELLSKAYKKFWIFGNFASLNHELIPSIIANLKYSILEYDYKFCKYRSPEKHVYATKSECDCHNIPQGKLISAFYCGAKSLLWMSEKQKTVYEDRFPFLKDHKNSTVLSSVLSAHSLDIISSLRKDCADQPRKGWVVLGSNSWIKGTDDAVAWCEKTGKTYTVIQGKTHEEFLKQLAMAEGFVYLPKGKDTCPRAVIEAKLLGCKLEINDDVQHTTEDWFATDILEDIEDYLKLAPQVFWTHIKENVNYVPTISGYTTTRNCIEQRYPFTESIQSMLAFCSEVVVVDGGSTDGTWEALQEMAAVTKKLCVYQEKRDWNNPRFAVFDGEQKAYARSLCTSEFCWQMDSDEIVDPQNIPTIIELIEYFPTGHDLLALPVVEYWGGKEKIRCDINPWKWRLSKNKKYITHGIPASLRAKDKDGQLYSSPGSDGCDYIHTDTHEPIPFITFHTEDAEAVRQRSHIDPAAKKKYEEWFNQAVERMPFVHHFSWWSLERKIKTYRGYWTKHWNSLYNMSLEDTADNNMFFDKPWSEVSDEEIEELAVRLKEKMGGWIFHKKINFSQPTKWINCNKSIPKLMEEWCQKNG